MLYGVAQVLCLLFVHLIAYYDCRTVCYLCAFHCASVCICHSALYITFVFPVCFKCLISYQHIRLQYLHCQFFS